MTKRQDDPTQPVMSELRSSVIGGCLVAIGPISLALYTPAMPTLVRVFETSDAMIKLSLSIYFAGFAFTQLICGPLSDAYGRRPTTIAFMVLYLAAAILAALAPNVETLLVARLLQGVGASVGIATARALVRDQFEGETSSRIMNTIAIILATGPAISPTIGGLTLGVAGWAAVFWLMVAFGLALIAITLFGMRETTIPDPGVMRPKALMRSYAELLSNRHFLTTSFTIAGSVGALYTLATILPFVLIDRAGLTPAQFGLGMLAQSGSFFSGSLAARYLMKRIGAYRLVPIGLALIGCGAVALFCGVALLPLSYAVIMVPVGAYAFGIAFVLPAMQTASLAPFPHMAGAASSVMGFIQMGAGLVGGGVAAAIGDPVLATQVVIPGLGLIAIASYLVYRSHPHLAEPEPRPTLSAPPMARWGRR